MSEPSAEELKEAGKMLDNAPVPTEDRTLKNEFGTFHNHLVNPDLHDFDCAETCRDVFTMRLRIEDAMKILKEYKKECDMYLIGRMKEEGKEFFKEKLANGMNIIKYGKVKKEKIVSTKRLIEMLNSEDEAERELATKAISGGQSAWKIAQVKVLADTLGIDDLIETKYEDKIEVKVIPIEQIEKREALRG